VVLVRLGGPLGGAAPQGKPCRSPNTGEVEEPLRPRDGPLGAALCPVGGNDATGPFVAEKLL
jgi:hypothetical protein